MHVELCSWSCLAVCNQLCLCKAFHRYFSGPSSVLTNLHLSAELSEYNHCAKTQRFLVWPCNHTPREWISHVCVPASVHSMASENSLLGWNTAETRLKSTVGIKPVACVALQPHFHKRNCKKVLEKKNYAGSENHSPHLLRRRSHFGT
jgi:hypothetical protein